MSLNRKECLPFVEQRKTMGKRALAKLLVENFPEKFQTKNPFESARSWLRTITGNNGAFADAKVKLKILDTFGKLPEEAEEENVDDYHITGHSRLGIINDIHSLYYDPDALYPALNYLVRHECDALLINGDMIDFYQLSRFDKDPSKAKFGTERKWGIDFLKMCQELFGNVYYKIGNHDFRFRKYMMKNAPAIYDEPEFSFENLFNFTGSKVKFIGTKQMVIYGKLAIIHGDEINSGGMINVARTKMLRAFANIAFGHHHKTDTSVIRDLYGKTYASYAIGCLCKLKPPYMRFNQWNHGFAMVELLDSDGKFKFHNKMIIDGEVL